MAKAQTKAVVSAKSAQVEQKPVEKKAVKLEGLTKETVATKVITFKAGSGSADLLALISNLGFNREKVIEVAKKLKSAGKAFLKSDPEKKYNKVAGIIKRMQVAGFQLPKSAQVKA